MRIFTSAGTHAKMAAFQRAPVPRAEVIHESTQVDIEVPLRAQIYFAGVLAVHAEVAAVLALVTNGAGFLGSESVSKGTYFAVPLTNLIGAFGATYYFP